MSYQLPYKHVIQKKKNVLNSTHTPDPFLVFVPYHIPAVDVAQVDDHIHLWGPELDLTLPGGER